MMTIQWFPGHMAKARRQIEEKLKLLDLVIELVDARIPVASRNPMIDEILKQKPRLVLLNKSDLADPAITEQWVHYFAEQKLEALPVDSSTGHRVQEIVGRSQKMLREKLDRQIRKGMNPRPLRALIVGIPNVGKSTLINRMAGRKIAATGDKPGVTKAQQWIKVGTEMELLDTPGILWPKFEDPEVGLKLAATGAIKEEIISIEEVAFYATKFLISHYADALKQRFELDELPDPQGEVEPVVEVMESIGRKRGCLQSGGIVNLEKASGVILRDMRSGAIGRITMERPGSSKMK
jgi:ribosome biogenesis GTPase A